MSDILYIYIERESESIESTWFPGLFYAQFFSFYYYTIKSEYFKYLALTTAMYFTLTARWLIYFELFLIVNDDRDCAWMKAVTILELFSEK